MLQTKSVKWLLGLLGISVVLGMNLSSSASVNTTVTGLTSSLPAQESAYFTAHGEYQQIPITTTADGVQYRVDQVKVWGGKDVPESQSYIVYVMRPDHTEEAFGVGPTASSSSFSWKTFTSQITSTTTSTLTTLQ